MPGPATEQERTIAVKQTRDALFDCELARQQTGARLQQARAQAGAADALGNESVRQLWVWRSGTLDVLAAALVDHCSSLSELLAALQTGSDADVSVSYEAVQRSGERANRAAADADEAAQATDAPTAPHLGVGRAIGAIGAAAAVLLIAAWAASRSKHERRTT